MEVENGVRVMAGTVVIVGVVLALTVNIWWLMLTATVGVMLIQSAFTAFCPVEKIFKKLGMKSCCSEKKSEEKATCGCDGKCL